MLIPIALKLAAIIASILGISFIVIFHEFGHYIFCKIFNVYTPTFSIGIGKILYSKKIGDTNFCISAGPIGGYVEVASEEGINGSLGFNQISYVKKVLIMLGGILFNFLLTYIVLVTLLCTKMPENATGYYEPCTTTIAELPKNSINAQSLQKGDTLLSVNHEQIHNNLSLARKIIVQNYQKESQLPAEILRNGENINIFLKVQGSKVSPAISSQLNVSFELKPALSIQNALKVAYFSVIFYTNAIIDGLKKIFHSKTTQGFVGPLMAIAASSKSAEKGINSLLFFLAIISINLGFMNLLPLPIFDGGQFVIFTIETIIKRQLSERIRHWIGISSWILAIGLLVLFTIKDLIHLIF
ncbi:site-2 protease family protein [Candidatus Dependentiae bacterium]|nr:site-2 protease family protein [Candidatus Dependentiae bacterium]